MDSSRGSSQKFWVIAALALALSTAGLAALWPAALAAAHHQSFGLVADGRRASGGEAFTDYQLAVWLNPANQAAFAGLASAQISNGQPGLALDSLSHAGQSPDVARLKVRTLIELGRNTGAADTARNLTAPGASPNDLVLAALAYAQAGRSSDIAAILPRVGSPEALTRVQRAQAGKLTLAAELSAEGLLNSSRVLLSALSPSFQRNLMLARIDYTRHTDTSLAQAATLLHQAISIEPANPAGHRLLSDVYTEQGNTAAATDETTLLNRLQAGRP
jgi:hypothetical protein